MWNRGGYFPLGCCAMQKSAERVDPHARVWRGNGLREEQGVHVFGIRIRHIDFVKAPAPRDHPETLNPLRASSKFARSANCLVLVLFCANTQATCSLRCAPPTDVSQFAVAHDAATWRCCMGLLGLPSRTDRQDVASLPFDLGGCGFAVRYEVARVCSLGQVGGQLEDDSSPASRCGGHQDHICPSPTTFGISSPPQTVVRSSTL